MSKLSLEDLIKGRGQSLYKKGKKLIPGGTQLLSKRPELFAPNVWPAYFSRAKGSKVWDLDGNKFIDMSIMAVGACILGYADDYVDNKVLEAIEKGVNSSLNCPEEIELAEKLIEYHPWFDMVRFSRSGGEAMAIAVRIARAKTKREVILFSGYHGWTDWYLAANLSDDDALDGQLMPGLEPNGIPRALAGTAIPFDFNDIDSLKEKIKGNEKNIAAIVIEPARGDEAPENYLKKLRDLADEVGAVLIFDEITSGFRMCVGGIHRNYKIYPDIAVFAKSMANGYAMAAIIGNEDTMQAAQKTFISSTNWTDRIGPTAALATIDRYIETKADDHIIKIGNKTKEIWRKKAEANSLDISISGLPSLASFSFNHHKSQEMNTRFVVEMLQAGFLGFRQFKASLAHGKEDLERYEEAVGNIFRIIANADENEIIETPIAQEGFQRLTSE
jgi:glutamate-1-semialdehyde aminotransferase